MLKRYQFRAYPTKTQTQSMAQEFGNARFVYNKYVELNLAEKKLASYSQAATNLLILKKEYEWLKNTSSIALQQSLKDATQGVANFFKNPKKVRPPKFKKRSNQQSFRIVGERSFKVSRLNNRFGGVKLPKMGVVKFRQERDFPSPPTSVTVVKNPAGQYFVSFVVEVQPVALPKVEKTIAIDLGLTTYATTINSEGVMGRVENPRFYRKAQTKLTKLQREYSRKTKGSNNKEKQRVRVAKQHVKVANQRKDFIRKLVLKLVSENQTIVTETLRVENMVKNHSLAKSIADAGWGEFLTQLSSKSEETGRIHTKVEPFFPSTKTCSACGTIRNKMLLSERNWTCPCGATHDRDINAAKNLLAVGSTESLNAQLILVGTVRSKLKV